MCSVVVSQSFRPPGRRVSLWLRSSTRKVQVQVQGKDATESDGEIGEKGPGHRDEDEALTPRGLENEIGLVGLRPSADVGVRSSFFTP